MATGSTAPVTLTRTPPDSVISIEPGLAGAVAAVSASGSGQRAGQPDLDRQQLHSQQPCGFGEPPAPFEQLVGVKIVPAGHDRHRRAWLERRRDKLTLQRIRPAPTLGTRFVGVRFAVGGHLSPSVCHLDRYNATGRRQAVPAGGIRFSRVAMASTSSSVRSGARSLPVAPAGRWRGDHQPGPAGLLARRH